MTVQQLQIQIAQKPCACGDMPQADVSVIGDVQVRHHTSFVMDIERSFCRTKCNKCGHEATFCGVEKTPE